MAEPSRGLAGVPDAAIGAWEMELLEQAMDGYRRFQLFKAAFDSGLFSWLNEHGAASAQRVAEAMHWSPHYGQMLLQALLEEGWLGAAGNRIHSCLGPSDLRGASSRLAELFAAWKRFPAVLPADGATEQAVADRDAAWRGSRNAALEREQVQAAVLAWPELPAARRLLDLGGTDADMALALCAAHPQLHAEVLVGHRRRAMVQRKLVEVGLEQRITLCERDVDSLDLQGMYDVVLAAHCFYGYPQAVLQTMETVAAHLRAGGLFVSQHRFEDGRSVVGQGTVRLLERRILQSRAPLHYPEAYADRISSAGMRLFRTEGGMEGEYGVWLHVAERG